jgi:hypothetical protein
VNVEDKARSPKFSGDIKKVNTKVLIRIIMTFKLWLIAEAFSPFMLLLLFTGFSKLGATEVLIRLLILLLLLKDFWKY